MIETSLPTLDEFLVGGIRKGIITDIYGANGTGKTQLAMQISINSLIQGGNVLYQDTTGDFRPERMLQLIKRQDANPNLLDKIKVARITNSVEQEQYLSKINLDENFSLIIIDNLTDLFSFEYSRENQILEKYTIFMNYMHKLALFSNQNNIPIVVTNIIRNFNNLEVENIWQITNFFTHIKINLSKKGKIYHAKAYSPFKESRLSYLISLQGLHELS